MQWIPFAGQRRWRSAGPAIRLVSGVRRVRPLRGGGPMRLAVMRQMRLMPLLPSMVRLGQRRGRCVGRRGDGKRRDRQGKT